MLRLRNTAVYRNRGILSDDILFIRQTQASMRFFHLLNVCLFYVWLQIYLDDGASDGPQSLHDVRAASRTCLFPFWWRYL